MESAVVARGGQVLGGNAAGRLRAAAFVLAASAVLAACSGSTSGGGNFPSGAGNALPTAPPTDTLSVSGNATASQLAGAAFEDVRGAKSVHVVTTSKNKKTTTVLDMHYADANAAGSVFANKIKVLLIRIGNDVYVNGPDEFWQAELGQAKAALFPKVRGKWVKNPTFDTTFTQIVRFTNQKTFLDSVVGGNDPSQFVKGADKVVNKVRTIPLINHQTGSIIYVPTTGKPYPVAASGNKGATTASSNFDSWNKAYTVQPPPASEVYAFTA